MQCQDKKRGASETRKTLDSRQVGIMPRAALAPPMWVALLPALMWASGLSTRRDSVRQPFSRPSAGCPAPWSSDSH